MSFRSDTQPYCRSCGKPIKKHVDTFYFGDRGDHSSRFLAEVFPRSKEEAQTRVNGKIISVAWKRYPADPWYDTYRKETGGDYIDKVTTWDGESYADEFFCTLRCAAELGEAVAAQGWSMAPYRKAMGLE